jgi:Maintenance of mitochondrial structure and function
MSTFGALLLHGLCGKGRPGASLSFWLGMQIPISAVHYVPDCFTLLLQAGKQKADINIGRYISDTLAAVPYISKEEFEQLYQDSTQDALLVMYLSSLVRAHVALADRLGTASLPLL